MNAACNVEKQRLMNAIYQCGFAISDITLFLDTHPKDPDALDYFHHMKHKYNHFVAEYETKFGPLTQTGEQRQNFWQWAMSPWPWERGYY